MQQCVHLVPYSADSDATYTLEVSAIAREADAATANNAAIASYVVEAAAAGGGSNGGGSGGGGGGTFGFALLMLLGALRYHARIVTL